MKYSYFFVLALYLCGCASATKAPATGLSEGPLPSCKGSDLVLRGGERHAYVTRVIDGDTIELRDGKKVRLVGVDTPETVHPRKPVQAFGKEASNFSRSMLEGKDVKLIFDQNNAHRRHSDKYNRLLAYVYRISDGLDFNAEIIRQGYAHAYLRFPTERGEEFLCLEREARSARRGLWGEGVDTSQSEQVNQLLAANANDRVYFNVNTLKYHGASCTWAKRCTKNCVWMKRSDAEQRGVPCKVCGGN